MAKYRVGGYVRLSRDDDYSESNRIVKCIDNIFIHEDKSIEIIFKEDINSI